MKKKQFYSLLTTLLFSTVIFTGCSDWLEPSKLGSLTDEEVYTNENNINTVLNGLYMEMAGNKLYGGHLALSTIELMSHYYYYPQNDPTNAGEKTSLRDYYWIANYNYGQDNVKKRFADIWEKGYEIIFSLNVFIDKLKASDAISPQRKNLLLGEVYGLRAFLHFDLFRLFGPVYKEDPQAESIPYNTLSIVSTYEYLPADQFVERLFQDIETAKEYLAEDIILTEGINDNLTEEEEALLTVAEIFQTCYRNRRFNYYAACALEARILNYSGKLDKAAEVALQVIKNTQENEELKLFQFVNKDNVVARSNYIFYDEVIFGLHNINLNTTWYDYMQGEEAGSVYSVYGANLTQNIFLTTGGELAGSTDVRASQWKESIDITNHYFSYKYRTSGLENTNNIKNFQPLIRISEMYYIIAENYMEKGDLQSAAEYIVKIQKERGIQEGQTEWAENNTGSLDELEPVLLREYYKEFFGEGQIFFFLKKKNYETIFRGYTGGSGAMKSEDYVVPKPTSETNV